MSTRLLALLAVCAALSAPARAQCRDFADGFGATQLGLTNASAAVEFDDGSGVALYAAGTQLAGTSSIYAIWRWDGVANGWTAVTPALSVSIFELVVHDDGSGPTLYAGTSYNAAIGSVLRWTGTDMVRVGTFGPDQEVRGLAVHDDGSGPKLYAGGRFQNVDGSPAARVARWDGSAWSALGAGVNNVVEDLVSYGTGAQARLVACGEFTHSGALQVNRIAQWNGSAWSGLGTGLTGGSVWPQVLHVADIGTGPLLYVGGTFTSAGGSPATNVARWNGAVWVGMPGTVTGAVVGIGDWNDGTGHGIYVGGPSSIGALATNGVARWNGSAWSALGSGLGTGNGVYTFLGHDYEGVERLWLVGGMSQAGGKPSAGVAVWGVPCETPTVTIAPNDVVAYVPSAIELHVEAIGYQPLSYQWRRNGVPISNGPLVVGATTRDLQVFHWSLDDAGAYDCVVTNPLGSTVSPPAIVTVPTGTPNGLPQPLPPRLLNGDVIPAGIVTSPAEPLPAADGAWLVSTRVDAGSGGVQALSEWRAGAVSVLARAGDPAPAPAGAAYAEPFVGRTWRSGGRLAYAARIAGAGISGANDDALFHRDATTSHLVAREGDPAPGVSPTATYTLLEGAPFELADGRTLYTSRWRDGAVNGTGVWTWTAAGGSTLVLKSGDPVPNEAATFSQVWSRGLALSGGALVVEGSWGSNVTAAYVASGGTLTKIAATGDPAPGFAPGSTFLYVTATHANASDDVLLLGTVLIGSFQARALYLWRAGALTTIAMHGDVVPGAGVNDVLEAPTAMALNDAGHVLFWCGVTGPCGETTCATRAVVLAANGALQLVTTNRVAPPAASPPGARFEQFFSGTLDALDRVTFESSNTLNARSGTYGWTAGTGVIPIATPGMQVALPGGVHGTVSNGTLTDNPLGAAPNGSPSADEPGRLALFLSFTQSQRPSGVFAASWSDILTLYGACPVVVPGPATQWSVPGDTAVLSATASGSAPLAYRWTRDGVDLYDGGTLSGADTATLSIASATSADSGTYAVRVSNACGSVDGAPTVLEIAPGIPYCFGDNSGQHCSCTPSPVGAAVGCLNSLAVGGRLRTSGVASLASDTVALLGSQMPNSSALYFQGTSASAGGNGIQFGDGLRCAAGSVLRLGVRQNSGGSSAYPSAGDAPVSVRGQVLAPGTRYYQCWYRNAANFCTLSTFNLTNGASISWVP